MGFPYGADEDAAFIIAWLELNNFQGIKLLAKSSTLLDKKYNGVINLKKNECKIDLEGSSVLMKGPGIIDYFKSKIKSNKNIELIIENCKEPLCFLPLLYKISNEVFFSSLIYYNKNKKTSCLIKKNSIKISSVYKKDNVKKNKVKIFFSNKIKTSSLFNIEKIITSDTIKKNLSKSLKPNIKDWEKVEKIAFRTYVPESEHSRLKGAGGGDDND
tara:strand:+ start:1417 stop:2061 length:645 start_codon:yes stop_codon:yes gene_type:complete